MTNSQKHRWEQTGVYMCNTRRVVCTAVARLGRHGCVRPSPTCHRRSSGSSYTVSQKTQLTSIIRSHGSAVSLGFMTQTDWHHGTAVSLGFTTQTDWHHGSAVSLSFTRQTDITSSPYHCTVNTSQTETIPTFPDKWNWTCVQNLSTQILIVYFSISGS